MVWQTENQEIAVIGTYIDVATEAGPALAIPPVAAPAPAPSGAPIPPTNETVAPASAPARFRIRRAKSQRRQEAFVPPATNETAPAVPPVQDAPDAPVSGAPTVLLETIFSTIDAIRTPGTVTQTPPLVLSEVVNIWKSGHFQGYVFPPLFLHSTIPLLFFHRPFSAFVRSTNPFPSNQPNRYSGSLTTPPCSEGVSWLVSTQTLRISPLTFEKVRSVIGFNSRITQNAPGQDNILAMAAIRQLNVFASSGAASQPAQ